VIELINFQKQGTKPKLEEYKDFSISHYQNKYISSNINQIEINNNYIVMYKIKELILKCYPQLILPSKKGLSLRKIMSRYELNNLPSFDKSK
jgi:hypothetical protein